MSPSWVAALHGRQHPTPLRLTARRLLTYSIAQNRSMLLTLNCLCGEELMTRTSALLRNSRLFEAVYPQNSPQSAVTWALPQERALGSSKSTLSVFYASLSEFTHDLNINTVAVARGLMALKGDDHGPQFEQTNSLVWVMSDRWKVAGLPLVTTSRLMRTNPSCVKDRGRSNYHPIERRDLRLHPLLFCYRLAFAS